MNVLEGMLETSDPLKPPQKEETTVKLVVEVTRVASTSVMAVKKSARMIERTTIGRQAGTSFSSSSS